MAALRKRRSVSRAIKGVATMTSSRLKTAFQSLGASVHPNPIFILGNQKAGTTAIAALLGEMTGRSVTLDLQKEMKKPAIPSVIGGELAFEEFVRINKLDFSREIIKEPSLTLLYRELVGYFADSRFVMVVRDPRENIRSILQRLRIPGDLDELDGTHKAGLALAWQLIVDGEWLGLDGANYVEMLAQRWNWMTDRYMEFKDRTELIRFEDFLEDKMGRISALADVLDLPRHHDISAKVDIPYQPPGDRSVGWEQFFGMDNLTRIEGTCGERMKLFGYECTSEDLT